MNAVATEAVSVVPEKADKWVNGLYLGKYNIHDPDKVKYAERTDFLKGLCGHIDHEETLEDVLAKTPLRTNIILELRELAQTYSRYKNKGARLPKFSRWVTGMFAGNKALAEALAAEGQKAAKRKIIMSVDVVDILRSADTPHFSSCFAKPLPGGYDYGYSKVPVNIAENCPGIGIIYVDDENGKMMGRQWMHHAKIKKTGEDILVLTPSAYGCLQGDNVARLLAERGIKVAIGTYYGRGAGVTPIEYIGCFTEEIHHDLYTWEKNPTAQIIIPTSK